MPLRLFSGAVHLFAFATATASASAVDSDTLLPIADWIPKRSVDTFITRNGARLEDATGGQWRFAGFNAYWLGLDENCELPSWGSGCTHYPSFFRINDTLTTAVRWIFLFSVLDSLLLCLFTAGVHLLREFERQE